MSWSNIVSADNSRQIDEKIRLKYQRKFHLTSSLIKRIGLISELKGHSGCVNCLEWSDNGEILVSGSDDCNIILWNPYRQKQIKTIQSGHQGNIFSVKYVKTTKGDLIASGAADSKIRVHDVLSSELVFNCSCHVNRVKRLASIPSEPWMFWSAAEDGFILQFDYREKHTCSQTCNNVLINLTSHIGPSAEAKCLTINPSRPELLAVGANDPYVRLYDRRMITLTKDRHPPPFSLLDSRRWRSNDQEPMSTDDVPWEPPASNLSSNCVQYFVAGHLQTRRKKLRAIACTYVSFNPQGNELLANLGGEQIYLFDINKSERIRHYDLSTSNGLCKDSSLNGCHVNGTNGLSVKSINKYVKVYGVKSNLPLKVQEVKKEANERFEKSDYIEAVSLYNKAISICSNSAVLYGNRAIALMKRNWDGDVYAALKDCNKALELDNDYFRAHFRLARCLCELKRYKEANKCFEKFKLKFPEEAKTQSCIGLEKEIKESLASIESTKEHDETTSNAEVIDLRSEESAFQFERENGNDEPTPSSSTAATASSPAQRLTTKRKPALSEQEIIWRANSFDFKDRFCGHCNTTTDIKEANFFGSDGQYIVAGSDDGNIFIWDRKTTNIVRVLIGDESIVNCLQPHPSDCLLATSGIDPVVRIWAPKPEQGPDSVESREVKDINSAAKQNQKLMYENPIELALLNMGYRMGVDSDSSEPADGLAQCRAS